MADMTRQKRPSFSMASWRAIALMTVESIPMWSAATRSMSMACWATPRKKLPPPTTMPIWQPRAWTAAISAAILWMKMASMPKPLPAAKASPEILRRILLYMSELSIAWEIGKAVSDGWAMCFSRFLGDGEKLCTTLHIRMGICRVGIAEWTPRSQGELFYVYESAFDGFSGWAGGGCGASN